MIPDGLAVSFDGGVRAAIQIECPNCHGSGEMWRQEMGSAVASPCERCDGSGRVSALSTVTLPEPPPAELDVPGMPESGPCERTLPFTLGLVLGGWDAGAAARIEADTGWDVLAWPSINETKRLSLHPPDAVGLRDAVMLPAGHLVATARVTDVQPVEIHFIVDHHETWKWRWHVSGVAVVDDPSPVTAPAGKAVWTP